MSINNQPSNQRSGFTLVEVLVIMPIVILVIGGLISAIVIMTGNVLATRSDNELIYSIQDALDTIENDIKISGGFLATNSLKDSFGTSESIQEPQGENNSNTAFSANGTTLILNNFATTASPTNATNQIIYTGNDTQCANNTSTPLTYNIVYFVSDNTLWRRTILPSDYATSTKCNNAKVWQKPSCSFDVVFSDYPSTCKVKDIKLVTGVESFTLEYYKSDGTAIADVEAAGENAYVKATINASGTAAGRKFTESGTIRATSPNNYKL